MRILHTCLLAGQFGLAVLLVLPAGAQDHKSKGDQTPYQNSPAYERGYQQGLKDRRDNREPNPGYAQGNGDANRPAYESGYQAGYCHEEESRTGYYTGTYHDYAPPIIRNGYYGYNAPSAYCEKAGSNKTGHQGGPESPQNRAEYGGGG